MSDRRFNGESGEICNFDYQWKQSWEFKTEISQPIGAYEQRRARWLRPLRSYTIPLNYKQLTDIDVLRKFFYDHKGQYDSFLFYDPSSKNRWTIPVNSIAYNSAMPTEGTWTDVQYITAIDKFIITGVDNTTAYSNDGIAWSTSTMPATTNYWTLASSDDSNVPYAVAVGFNSNKSAYTVNGINWYATTLPITADWASIACGNGTFVAISMSGKIARSPNGVNMWTVQIPTAQDYYIDITYGSSASQLGTFVAVGSNVIKYSTDLGNTWTSASVTGAWTDIAYGSGTFVTVGGTNFNKIVRSSDGITWASATLPVSLTLRGIVYGDGKFVTLGYGTNKAYYSTDAITWSSATLPATTNWNKVTYGNGKFIAISLRDVGSYTTKVTAYSTDGITWTYDPSYISKAYLPFKNVYPLDTTPTFGEGGDIRVWVSATERTTNMTVDQEEGSITFTSDYPESGQEIEVEYSNYVRVRFNSDIIEVTEQRHNLESLTIELKEVR